MNDATDRPTDAEIDDILGRLYHAYPDRSDELRIVREWLAPIVAAEVARQAGPLVEACQDVQDLLSGLAQRSVIEGRRDRAARFDAEAHKLQSALAAFEATTEARL